MPLPDMKALSLFFVVPMFGPMPCGWRGDPPSSVLVICEPISRPRVFRIWFSFVMQRLATSAVNVLGCGLGIQSHSDLVVARLPALQEVFSAPFRVGCRLPAHSAALGDMYCSAQCAPGAVY